MYIAAAFARLTYSYNTAYEETSRISNSEDGQFQVKEPLSADKEQKLLDAGLTMERAFYYDVEMDDGSVLRIMKVRQNIDRIILDSGDLPKKDTKAVMDKCYAFHHRVGVSDAVSVAGRTFQVTGIGSVTDYDSPSKGMDDYSSDSRAFGILFVTQKTWQAFLGELGRNTKEMCVYAYRLPEGKTDDEIRTFLIHDLGEKDNVIKFIPKENNNRIGAARDDNKPYSFVGAVTGIGLLVMISLIFYLQLQHTLDRDSPSIGALLAMGVKKKDIYPMILVPYAAAGLIGGLIGFALSRVFTLEEMGGSEGYYCIPYIPMKTNIWIFLYCVVMPPLICTLINLLLIRSKVSGPVVTLLNPSNEAKRSSKKWIVLAMLAGTLLTSFFLWQDAEWGCIVPR